MKNLPTINELYNEQVILSKQNDLNILLNQKPKDNWIKKHPIAKNVKYIPIERTEWLLTNIYVKWKVELLREGLFANSVYCAIRLHYRDPITGVWDWQDGIGAAPLQTDKEASATDWAKIKSDAVMKALPAAESFAVKDAAEKLGKLFGKDLNRADQIMYDSLANKFRPDQTLDEKTKELIEKIESIEEDGLREMYREDCKKAKKENKFNIEFIDKMLEKIQ